MLMSLLYAVLLLLGLPYLVKSLQILLIGEQSNANLFTAAKLGVTDNLNDVPSFLQFYNDQDDFLDNICQLNTSLDAVIDLSQSNIGSEDIAIQMDALIMSMKEWTPQLSTDMYTIPTVKPPSNQFIQSVVTFINSLNGTIDAVLILFSKSFDSSLLFPSQGSNSFIPVYMNEVNTSNVPVVISLIKTLRVSEIILATDLNLGALVIQQAQTLGILNGVYHWYFVTRGLLPFSCPSCGSGIFLHFHKMIDNQQLFSKIMMINSSLAFTDQVIEMIYAYQAGQIIARILTQSLTAGKWNSSSSNFNCWNASSSMTTTPYRYNLGLSIIKTINMPGVIGDINLNQTNRNQVAKMLISEVTTGSNPSTVNNVIWTRDGGLSINNLSSSRVVMKTLKILVIQEPPFVIKMSNGTFQGYSIDIVRSLSKSLNFQYEIYEQLDGQYGVVQPNGSYNGLIGAIASNQYDMGIGAITITSDRELVVDFSIPYYDYSAIQIMMSVVSVSTQGDQMFFLKAFTWDVWVTVIATIIGTGFLITFVDKISPFSFQNRLKNDELRDGEADGKIFTIKESMWFVLGAYTQAGESFDPRSISCRVIVVGLWLFSYLMMAMYTANLAAQLTVAQLANRPGSITDLAAQQTMVYTTQANTSIYDYFYRMQQAEADIFRYWTQKGIDNINNPSTSALMSTWQYPVNEMYTNMFNKMSAWEFTANISDSIDKIVTKDYAVFLETPIIKYYTNMDCRLMAVGDPFSQRPYGIVLQNNSPLLNNLNLQILIMQRDRILEELKVKWWNNNTAVCNVIDPTAGLGLDTLGGAFIFLAVGIGIAGIIFVFENIIAKVWGTDWARMAATDATVIRPTGMMSTINVNYGSHISIRRMSHGEMRSHAHPHHHHVEHHHVDQPVKLSIPNSEEHKNSIKDDKIYSLSTVGEENHSYETDLRAPTDNTYM